jgi:hypothetical protein
MASPIRPYGPAINDALSDPKTKLTTLKALQKRGYETLKAHGDLKGSLKKLDKYIKGYGTKK